MAILRTNYTWASIGTSTTDVAPDSDLEIPFIVFEAGSDRILKRAKSVSIHGDTEHTDNASTDADFNLETSPDGVEWDTEPLLSFNLGDAKAKTRFLTTGAVKGRMRADNNDGSNAGSLKAIVTIDYEKYAN